MKSLIVLSALVVVALGQLDEYQHFGKSIICDRMGFRSRNPSDNRNVYYRNGVPKQCGVGAMFSMNVCNCIRDQTQIQQIPRRPFCQRLLNVSGTSDLQTTNNGHFISYSGNANSIFQNLEAVCYNNAYFELNYMESNDFGQSLNLRFAVRFMNFANVVNQNDETVNIMTNGDCGLNEVPTFKISYNPTNDSYLFVADQFWVQCRMNPRRNNLVQNQQADIINLRFSNGGLSVVINDALINRSGCTANTQNIFSQFIFKWMGTNCPLKIGNPVAQVGLTGARNADVCLSSLQLNRDCPLGA